QPVDGPGRRCGRCEGFPRKEKSEVEAPLALLGHDEVHKLVKFTLRNPKLEFRNPKQAQNPNFQITKTHQLGSWRVLSFQFGTFDIVSDFELRISSFISAYEVARYSTCHFSFVILEKTLTLPGPWRRPKEDGVRHRGSVDYGAMLTMRRLPILLLVLASAAALPAQPARRLLKLDDLERMREVRDPWCSPDGRWVAYVVSAIDVKE